MTWFIRPTWWMGKLHTAELRDPVVHTPVKWPVAPVHACIGRIGNNSFKSPQDVASFLGYFENCFLFVFRKLYSQWWYYWVTFGTNTAEVKKGQKGWHFSLGLWSFNIFFAFVVFSEIFNSPFHKIWPIKTKISAKRQLIRLTCYTSL